MWALPSRPGEVRTPCIPSLWGSEQVHHFSEPQCPHLSYEVARGHELKRPWLHRGKLLGFLCSCPAQLRRWLAISWKGFRRAGWIWEVGVEWGVHSLREDHLPLPTPLPVSSLGLLISTAPYCWDEACRERRAQRGQAETPAPPRDQAALCSRAQRGRGMGGLGVGAAYFPGPEITRGTCPAPSQREGPTSKSEQNEGNIWEAGCRVKATSDLKLQTGWPFAEHLVHTQPVKGGGDWNQLQGAPKNTWPPHQLSCSSRLFGSLPCIQRAPDAPRPTKNHDAQLQEIHLCLYWKH